MYAGKESTVRNQTQNNRLVQIGKGVNIVKAEYCHPDSLTYTQSTSWENLDWIKHRPKSRLLIKNLRHIGDIIIVAESEDELKSLLMKVHEESVKVA